MAVLLYWSKAEATNERKRRETSSDEDSPTFKEGERSNIEFGAGRVVH